MDKLYIVMPTYNEELNIEQVVRAWYPKLMLGGEDSKLVVADSQSTDSTHEILLRLKEEFENLEILSDTRKEHGPKLLALYKYAINEGADFVFQTDSDGQTNPDEFDAFYELRNDYDALFGNRKHREDGKIRYFVEKVLCFIIILYFGVKIPDTNVPFRLMKTKPLADNIIGIPEDFFLTNVIVSMRFNKEKGSCLFKEISFARRAKGENSVNMRRLIKVGLKSLKDFLQFR